jgi:geranylgeranylglycerol-phosphate geranylgeranyltransferase
MVSVAISGKQHQETNEAKALSFAKSQLVLFQSRKKFAFLYCLATVTGLFCLPGVLGELSSPTPDLLTIVRATLPLPIASLLVTAGTYILNDLADADLDKANGKKRPIPSGLVSKKQARIFVMLAFGTAVLLTVITFRPTSLVVLSAMLVIGIAYSMPKIALMKRFVIKTLSIAVFYILCALLGMTSTYSLDLAINNPLVVASVFLTLALMVFISSTLNDMGDTDGDRAAGRRTIPIVIGKDSTLKLTTILAASILAVTWIFYGAGRASGSEGSIVTTITTTVIALVVMMTLCRMRRGLHETEFMRKQHKKLFPFQMAIHPSLVIGTLML